ncbi:Sulfite reductase [NADPH] flavoprotein alpha-component [Posidoniimonas polymericola]|uniref:assimilatory sulfite reductase (NADPH) n=1 Tax=Posidoniimonas polymericola TaxID=2528002 RepID=A0A5C5YLY5_9BACT|nr:sulfite reductase subunit alpha [Posidoniimonas polymericola]TWT75850.1 Sulfite reductase [NADPH] flavoprotein alpha-component [Posidoniimonas polymericola]
MSISIIPESAPFSPEQRSWLNGFLAGWAGVVADPQARGQALASALMPPAEAEVEQGEEFPWHDPALEIEERMKLAEKKPLERKMMAAMAQLDCGACGYVCQTYSEAIAGGDEKNLTLCSPGGKETAKMLKKLVKSGGATANGAAKPATNGAAVPVATGFSRTNPYAARIKTCYNLNAAGSSKATSHVEIELGDSGLDYVAGDALGVFPTNCPELVDEILPLVGAGGNEAVKEQLVANYCLRGVTDELLELLAEAASDVAESAVISGLIDSDELDVLDVLDVLRKAPSAQITAEQLIECLSQITPRLYSIASSPSAHPGEVHLTVGRATFESVGRVYKGVASTMFADRSLPDHRLKVYVHKSHGFGVPSDPNAPMIMVGPGTGIAPFRAFLEEREATGAAGKNWLFFGDQHAATDFLYEEQLASMAAKGVLDKLSTAFSRDQETKVYVQDRMREEGAELFAWLEEGGSFFVCGDARRMAVDVDRALHDVIAQHGGMSEEQSTKYVAKLKEAGRYVRDVY